VHGPLQLRVVGQLDHVDEALVANVGRPLFRQIALEGLVGVAPTFARLELPLNLLELMLGEKGSVPGSSELGSPDQERRDGTGSDHASGKRASLYTCILLASR
jgi:hypothetical protein